MKYMERDVINMRQYTIRKHKGGWTGNKIARELQIPRRTAYDWIEKYQNCNEEEMYNELTRKEMEVDKETRRYVIRLREKWNWGPNKIEGYIRVYKPKDISPISHKKIYAILVEEGLNLPIDFVREVWGKTRFVRLHSNTLWQTDFKLLDNDNWICTYIDDHARFITGGKEFSENITGEIALEILQKAGKKYGFPEQVLTDQGSEFYDAPSKVKKQGVTYFTRTLNELGIQHIVASKRRPTTIGKIEAFHKGVKYEAPKLDMDFRKYVSYWNNKRPHQELKYKIPKDVYFKDFKKKED